MRIWLDVEDLIRFFQHANRPTGIQRFSFETSRALWQHKTNNQKIAFCRRNPAQNGLREVHFPALEAGILAITQAASSPAPPPAAPKKFSALGRLARQLPAVYRRPLGKLTGAALTASVAAAELAAALLVPLRPRGRPITAIGGHAFELRGPDIAFSSGDWLVNLGASWEDPYNPTLLARLRAQGVRFAYLAHDLIPALFPEWCTPRMVADFAAWLTYAIPNADLTFAVSRHTAADLAAQLRAQGQPIAPPIVLPVGSTAPARHPETQPLIPQPYVLMVGTIEIRKNHAAMLRVWRNLLQTMPEAEIPTLVIAGKFGWLTADLRGQLTAANWLGGKIRWVENPSDATLASLYQHCLFTLFPSLYEGWGLPVTESLCHGKTAAASNRAAIPEAGCDFCTYFDPDNITGATETIRALIQTPGRIAALERQIARHFRPPGWSATAAALLAQLNLHPAKPAPMPTPRPTASWRSAADDIQVQAPPPPVSG